MEEQKKTPQETALIKTINVISSENVRLQMQLERAKAENEQIKAAVVVTGRGGGGGRMEAAFESS